MAKQTDCSEISPDAEMYIMEQAPMGLYAATPILTLTHGQASTYHARGEKTEECVSKPLDQG